MVVPKRAAMLLDRIMVALHHALEDNDREGIQRIADMHKMTRHPVTNVRLEKEMLQQFKGLCDSIRNVLPILIFLILIHNFVSCIMQLTHVFQFNAINSWNGKWLKLFWNPNRFECRNQCEWNWRTTFNRWIGTYEKRNMYTQTHFFGGNFHIFTFRHEANT